MERSLRKNSGTITGAGAVSIAVGCLLLLVYPYLRAVDPVFLFLDYTAREIVYALSPIATCLGAILVGWGVSTLRQGRVDSLLPTYALIPPLLIVGVLSVSVFITPPTDTAHLFTPPTDTAHLYRASPSTFAEFLNEVFIGGQANAASWVLVSALLLLVGVAQARDQNRWVIGGRSTIVAVWILTSIFSGGLGVGAGYVVMGAIFGVVPYLLGSRFALPLDADTRTSV